MERPRLIPKMLRRSRKKETDDKGRFANAGG